QRLVTGRSFDAETGKLKETDRVHLDEERSLRLAEALQASTPWTISSLESKPGSQKPAAPFITSTLQQEANRKLRMTSRHTMRVAQRLYEGIDLEGERVGLITYMRTDSVTLSGRALEQTRQMIAETYGQDYLPGEAVQYKTKAKRAQEAHEAIRPTDLTRRPQDLEKFLDRDELRLYELIWKRTVACQMVPARFERTSVEVSIAHDGQEFTFVASGRRIVFPGFLRAYVEGADDPEAELGDQESHLPALARDQELKAESVAAEGHTTKAPYRYTEASLVKKLEEEGIGRPSTYASIIGTIQDRDYAFKRGNELVPTFTAFCVTHLLEKQFRDLVDTHFTARMEDELDDVADGKAAWDALVSDFFLGDEGAPGLQKRLEESELFYPAIAVGDDEKTGEPIVVKIGPKGSPYLRRGEGEKSLTASVPEDIAPDELTLDKAVELLRSREGEAPQVGTDADGRAIFLKTGRFGPYLEVDQTEAEKEAKEKPRRTSLPRGLKPEDVTDTVAAKLVLLPRVVGVDPADGEEVSTAIGRFGPYVKKGKEFRSLGSWEEACDIEMAKALEVLAQPKTRGRQQKKILKELGELEGAPGPVNVLEGRYGPYVTDGETNASLPRGTDPESVTPEQALELLEKRRNAPKKPKRKRRR
ncbi:MAG: type I DNA topoisomerase, partial [Acidobacteriota bacterium]